MEKLGEDTADTASAEIGGGFAGPPLAKKLGLKSDFFGLRTAFGGAGGAAAGKMTAVLLF